MSSSETAWSEWRRRDEARAALAARRQGQLEQALPELVRLLEAHGVREAYLFGSMVSGRLRPESDVDIAVGGARPDRFFALAAELERALDLPLDLVDLDRVPPEFAHAVREAGRRLYP